MTETTPVVNFQIDHLQFLDEKGEPTQALPKVAEDKAKTLELYEWIMRTRIFDNKAVALQRTGRLGTYPSSYGQEAITVAMGNAMEKDDVFFPYYREFGTHLQRGVKMEEIYLFWGGDERGSDYQNNSLDFPHSIPIASQCLHAAGAGSAFKLRKEKRVAVTIVGEGGTSKGDFYEAMNLAGAWQLPVVFVINNNHWAISVPKEEQTGAETFAQKGIACGLKCVQVDGNDIFAVYHAMQEALTKARNGEGATVIEAITYRLSDHTTADDATRYRSSDVLDEAKQKEPVIRLKKYMEAKGWWSDEDESALKDKLSKEVEKAVENYLSTEKQPVSSIFDYLYAELPEAYHEQRDLALMAKGEKA